MRLFDNLPDCIKTHAEEIYAAGYAKGFEHATLCFQWHPVGYAAAAENATHVAGTESPEAESWEEMKKRETEAGAITCLSQ